MIYKHYHKQANHKDRQLTLLICCRLLVISPGRLYALLPLEELGFISSRRISAQCSLRTRTWLSAQRASELLQRTRYILTAYFSFLLPSLPLLAKLKPRIRQGSHLNSPQPQLTNRSPFMTLDSESPTEKKQRVSVLGCRALRLPQSPRGLDSKTLSVRRLSEKVSLPGQTQISFRSVCRLLRQQLRGRTGSTGQQVSSWQQPRKGMRRCSGWCLQRMRMTLPNLASQLRSRLMHSGTRRGSLFRCRLSMDLELLTKSRMVLILAKVGMISLTKTSGSTVLMSLFSLVSSSYLVSSMRSSLLLFFRTRGISRFLTSPQLEYIRLRVASLMWMRLGSIFFCSATTKSLMMMSSCRWVLSLLARQSKAGSSSLNSDPLGNTSLHLIILGPLNSPSIESQQQDLSSCAEMWNSVMDRNMLRNTFYSSLYQQRKNSCDTLRAYLRTRSSFSGSVRGLQLIHLRQNSNQLKHLLPELNTTLIFLPRSSFSSLLAWPLRKLQSWVGLMNQSNTSSCLANAPMQCQNLRFFLSTSVWPSVSSPHRYSTQQTWLSLTEASSTVQRLTPCMHSSRHENSLDLLLINSRWTSVPTSPMMKQRTRGRFKHSYSIPLALMYRLPGTGGSWQKQICRQQVRAGYFGSSNGSS